MTIRIPRRICELAWRRLSAFRDFALGGENVEGMSEFQQRRRHQSASDLNRHLSIPEWSLFGFTRVKSGSASDLAGPHKEL